jgi:hypothetical protein
LKENQICQRRKGWRRKPPPKEREEMITRASVVSSILNTLDIPGWMFSVKQVAGNSVVHLRDELVQDPGTTKFLIMSLQARGYDIHRNGMHWLIVSKAGA